MPSILLLEHLFRLAKEIVGTRCGREFDREDHLGFMMLNYLAKQVDHGEAVVSLCQKGLFVDAALIARAMLEGMAFVGFAGKSPDTRPRRWRLWAVVYDYRLLLDRRSRGHPPPDEIADAVTERAFGPEGMMYFRASARNMLRNQGHLDDRLREDPFVQHWYQPEAHTIRDVFDEADVASLYEDQYVRISKWSHWGIEGYADLIDFNWPRLDYSGGRPWIGEISARAAFHALWHVTHWFNARFEAGFEDPIDALLQEAIKLDPDPTSST